VHTFPVLRRPSGGLLLAVRAGLVTVSGRRSSLVLQRGSLVGLGCRAEGAEPLVIAVRAAAWEVAIWRCAEASRSRTVARSGSSCRSARNSATRADSVNPLPDLVSVDRPGPWLAAHPSSMPAAGDLAVDGYAAG
jgi:hypothetical protein